MFDGAYRRRPQIALGGRNAAPVDRATALQRAHAAREQRARDRQRDDAATALQRWLRALRVARAWRAEARARWLPTTRPPSLACAQLAAFYRPLADAPRVATLARYVDHIELPAAIARTFARAAVNALARLDNESDRTAVALLLAHLTPPAAVFGPHAQRIATLATPGALPALLARAADSVPSALVQMLAAVRLPDAPDRRTALTIAVAVREASALPDLPSLLAENLVRASLPYLAHDAELVRAHLGAVGRLGPANSLLWSPEHIAALFQWPHIPEFCTAVAPLLPHVPLHASPFAALARPGLIDALYVQHAQCPGHAATWVLADALRRVLAATGDADFHASKALLAFLDWLRPWVLHTLLAGGTHPSAPTCVALLQHLHARDARKPFTERSAWYVVADPATFTAGAMQDLEAAPPQDYDDDNDDSDSDTDESKQHAAMMRPRLRVLRDVPFLVPFESRVHLFRTLVARDKQNRGIADQHWVPDHRRVVIRRDHILEDGFTRLNPLGSALRDRLAISFVSELGTIEAGIDGGGVFKEFFTLLAGEMFAPAAGLFAQTPEGELYPVAASPAVSAERRRYHYALLAFVGRVVGKALYDGILVDAAFAPFFLKRWLGGRNSFDDLPSLDAQLYNSLLFLQHYAADKVEDLSLTFALDLDDGTTVDLVPGGSSMSVDASNRLRYCYLVADYKLNRHHHRAVTAFLAGMFELVSPAWLRMFTPAELGLLLCGTAAGVDIDDMRAHTTYGAPYDETHPTIHLFWRVVRSLGADDQHRLVRFITSCPRAPLLGFRELDPPLCIRPNSDDQDRLPTSSTCVNLLKLPVYTREQTMRDKLVYAIRSGAGFELS